MRLIDDWRWTIRYAWSIRLIIVAGFFAGAEVALPFIDQWLSIPRGLFAAISGFTSMAALISKFVAQKRSGDGE